MFWRVQTAWWDALHNVAGLHPTFMGREEHLAKRDVARLFRTWILKNLMKVTAHYMGRGGWLTNFAYQGKLVADSIARHLEAGDVWGAYDVFHQFQDQFSPDPRGIPAWVVMGTIIVEAPPGKGPNTRKRWLTPEDFPKEMPKDIVGLMDIDIELEGTGAGAELGAAARRWKIWWSDFGGRRHASYHMREVDAMNHLATLLRMHMEKLHQHASTEAIFAEDPDRKDYAEQGIQLVFQVRDLLEHGAVWDAYERFRLFETEFMDVFPIPLAAEIGTVRAEVE